MKYRSINVQLLLSTIILGFLVFNVYASPVKTYIRASEDLITENPINKIVIVGAGKVIRPRMGGKDAILSLSGSKLFVEDSVRKIKQAFETKGYQVVFAEPIGIGYYSYDRNGYWIYDYEAKAGESDKWRSNGMAPAYEYPSINGDNDVRMAARNEFERINRYLVHRRLVVYDPKKENLATIAESNQADTVCFVRMFGKRYSSAREAGDIALKALAALFGTVSTNTLKEYREAFTVCAAVNTGQVIWQYSHSTSQDPLSSISTNSTDDSSQSGDDDDSDANDSPPNDSFFDNALARLPAHNQHLAGECKMTDRVRMTVTCVAN
jgi:hypothetical protein